MKFVSIWKPDSTVWSAEPDEKQMAAMGQLIGELMSAGVLLDTGGVSDGPFTETKELVGGFAIFKVNSRDEAIALTRRFLEIAGDGTSELHEVSEFS